MPETVHDAIQRPHCTFESRDESLRAGALKLLHSNGYTPLRRLRCEVTEGVVMIQGNVPSYYLKQMVQTVIRRLEGIQGVMNMVQVTVESHEVDNAIC